ncbi:hypothetical protein [Streptomyces sp. ISL-43]|nr:hypothetical protein [Streptomyces sp. ISL-43]
MDAFQHGGQGDIEPVDLPLRGAGNVGGTGPKPPPRRTMNR